MKRWLIGGVLFAVLLFVGFLYFFFGLRQYIRSQIVIATSPVEQRQKVKDEFYGSDNKIVVKGILAGNLLNRIWIWNRYGLTSYLVDQSTVYSVFDGCSQEVREKLNRGEKDVIEREIYTSIDIWSQKVNVGDYVVMYKTLEGNGGTIGNLREIYGYNFWLFLMTGVDVECAK